MALAPEGLGTALAVHLLRQYSTSPRTRVIHKKGGLALRPRQRVIDYINEHLQDELSLFELARIANLSPHHFATVFKASTGISPHRYVIERRIDRARDLLRQDEKTISEIAYAVGFSWHKADMLNALTNVRFWGQSGSGADAGRSSLLTQSGHRLDPPA